MTEAEILDGVVAREGGFVDDPTDRGGATKWGITAGTLGAWRKLGRPATREEVRALDLADARAIYRQMYITAPGFTSIADGPLRAQMVDDGVLSGTRTAIMTLQRALGVAADGVIGPSTRAALREADPITVHVRVVKARLLRFGAIVREDPAQSRFLVGWMTRALGFLDDHGRPCV